MLYRMRWFAAAYDISIDKIGLCSNSLCAPIKGTSHLFRPKEKDAHLPTGKQASSVVITGNQSSKIISSRDTSISLPFVSSTMRLVPKS